MFNLSKTPESIRAASEQASTFKVYAMDGKPELMIYDDIGENFFGDGISETTVKAFLNANPGEVSARFNSFGGDAYAGLVIHNAFREHGNVTAVIDGIAFSAAAIAAAEADKIVMQEQSNFGIHRSWTIAAGNRNGLMATVEWLDAVDGHQVDIFSRLTGESREQITNWLDGTDDGTVFDAKQAVELGFASEIAGSSSFSPDRQAASKAARAQLAIEIQQKRLAARLQRC